MNQYLSAQVRDCIQTVIRLLCPVDIPKRILVFIISLFISSQPGFAEFDPLQDNWRIVHYGPEDGLSQISVNSIIQDSYGFLWIATQDGLNKYDGYDFDIYRHQPSDPSSLSNGNVRSVIEDRDGNIWAGTQDGLNKLDRSTNSFIIYRHEPGNSSSLSDNDIYFVFEDGKGIIWLKTAIGIDRFDPVTEEFSNYKHYHGEPEYFQGPESFTIFEDSQGRLWIGSWDGLLYFDRLAKRFTRYNHEPDKPQSISNNNVRCIMESSKGQFLIGTADGLNIFDRKEELFHSYYIDMPGPGSSLFNTINSIVEDDFGNIWVGTDGGLFIFSVEDGLFTPFSGRMLSRPFFDREVSVVFEDRSNNIWAGTLGGLYMIDSKSKFGVFRIHDYLPEAPTPARFIASVFQATSDDIWLGTWGAGLFLTNRATGKIIHYSSNSPLVSRRISNDFVHVIFSDSQGRILIGTRDGMDIYNSALQSFEPYCPSADNQKCSVFRSNRIYSIFEDSDSILWVGSLNGLHSFKDGVLKSYYHDQHDSTSISSSQVRDIFECQNGYIWLATTFGLNRFDKSTDEFSHYIRNPDKGRFSLSNNELTCVHEDSKGNLWIGSVAGLNRFFPETGSFMVFSEMEGLPNNLIYDILEDNDGNLWLSTNNGLSRLNTDEFEITNYDVADGLQSYEFNLGASFKSETGEMFFGGINGLNWFYPDSLRINQKIPPLAITSFEVASAEGNRKIFPEGKKEIILQHYDNSFTIEFSALDYTRPAKNRYAYMLEGLDDKWIYTGNRRLVSFSGIAHGTYYFRIKGSNNDNVWNEEGNSIRIVILTPWWKSPFAYFLSTILVGVLLYLLIFYSTRKLRIANYLLREKEIASEKISVQKEQLALKNRNITDSINYARRIQLAMMPTSQHLRKIFNNSFVFYSPKDIVSGDFYWVNQRNDKVFIAVIDCTGHGVPGAFMSIIGYELLRNIINVKGVEKPSDILNELNVDFSEIFGSGDDNDYTFRDGMDIGFCVVDKRKGILEFSGAFSPLYLIRDKSIIEVKGNRFSVGLMQDLIDQPFDNNVIKLEKEDVFYLFSDGYSDQFGGEEGKKYKYRRFRHLLLNIHNMPPKEQERLLGQSINQWMGDHEQVDDILIIGVKPGLG